MVGLKDTPLHRAELDYLGYLFTQSSQGVWTPTRGTVITTDREKHPECDCAPYYGGHLLAESIVVQADAQWIAATHNEFPRLVRALQAQLALR